jgi:RNA polymerase sigma-70 factor (ECF subfamily)
LVDGLRDPRNRAAWQQFDEAYRPFLVKYGLGLGLVRNDAEEAAQRVTVAVVEAFRNGGYDRARGRFRNWLLGIARNKIADLCAQRAKQPLPASQRSSVEAVLATLKDPKSLSAIWDAQWREHVLAVCLQQAWRELPERDMRIFELLTTDERATADVARQMGMTRNAVYKTKYRVLRHMSQVREVLEGER